MDRVRHWDGRAPDMEPLRAATSGALRVGVPPLALPVGVAMHPVGPPLVFGRGGLVGLSDANDAERHDVGRDFEYFRQPVHPFLDWRYATPYGSETRGVGGEENVLRGSGAVLQPVSLALAVERALVIAADDNDLLAPVGNAGVGQGRLDAVEEGFVVDHDELPGLRVDGRWGCHACAEESLDLAVGEPCGLEDSDAGPGHHIVNGFVFHVVLGVRAATGQCEAGGGEQGRAYLALHTLKRG